ncbi:MAG TPA: cyclic 2,3-diphosphoglycerate synthase [Thermoplasmata archaeon]|jgi:predicted GTPase|nr:cyclic 2,3-diphosphoglycerate synthase [Thermoplasmata archaeon]
MARTKVIIIGAAGRDFHNFNVVFRDRKEYEVVAFTAAQIPGIVGRRYPASLAGKLYPEGIPIFAEEDLPQLIYRLQANLCVFSYSDLSYDEVMHRAAIANAAGADFTFLGTRETMLESTVPVIAVTAVRTGAGKSQTTRKIASILKEKGKRVVVVRHPMPYGVLEDQAVERFGTYADLEKYKTTIEEREEYEPHLERGIVVFAGVDYEKILRAAEKEADVVIWDGGNNDTPFFKPKLHIVLLDPLRPGDELRYFPGETNLRMADVAIVNKVDSATPENVELVKKNAKEANPNVTIVEAASPITVVDPEPIRNRKVLVVEDGPTVTHGQMAYGAAFLAAKRMGAAEIVDPRPFAVGSIKTTFKKYAHLHNVLPAMGYGDKQVKELEDTINAATCDVVVSGTPVDLRRIVKANKPIVRVRYELDEIGRPNLEDVLRDWEFL